MKLCSAWVSAAGQNIQPLLVCDYSRICPFQHGIFEWHPSTRHCIEQLKINDGTSQTVSASPELLHVAQGRLLNDKAVPAVSPVSREQVRSSSNRPLLYLISWVNLLGRPASLLVEDRHNYYLRVP